jgi:hypothetical protein
MRRHEQHVAVLQADVARCVAANQMVVDVERLRGMATAPDLDCAQRATLRRTGGGVQRRQRGAGAGYAVAAGHAHITDDEHLVGAKSCDAHRETRGAADAGEYTTESLAQHAIELAQREVRDGDLAGGRHDDEALARHVERVRFLDVTREDEHELVARTEPIGRIHRAAGVGVELRRRAREQLEAEQPGSIRLRDLFRRKLRRRRAVTRCSVHVRCGGHLLQRKPAEHGRIRRIHHAERRERADHRIGLHAFDGHRRGRPGSGRAVLRSSPRHEGACDPARARVRSW